MNPPRLMDQVRDAVRTLHYSLRTERTYLQQKPGSDQNGTYLRPHK